jgi:PAS domain S-box-containing protein
MIGFVVVKRITSIENHVKAVQQHVRTIRHLQESQTLIHRARQRLHTVRVTPDEYVKMLEELPLPAYFLDRERSIFIAANSQFCKVLGYSAQEMIGLPLMKALAEDLEPTLEKALRKDPPEKPIEWRFRRSDGSQIALLLKYRRISLLCGGKKLANVSFTTVLRSQGDIEFEAEKYFS